MYESASTLSTNVSLCELVCIRGPIELERVCHCVYLVCLCQTRELERVCLHDSKRSSVEHTRRCAESLMLLGQSDRAVQLLLETDAAHDTYYIDSLRSAHARAPASHSRLRHNNRHVSVCRMHPNAVTTRRLF